MVAERSRSINMPLYTSLGWLTTRVSLLEQHKIVKKRSDEEKREEKKIGEERREEKRREDIFGQKFAENG